MLQCPGWGLAVAFFNLLRELRAPFFTASIMPVLAGCAMAYYHTGRWDWTLFFLTLLGVVAIHAGANTANDYFDHVSGNDAANHDYVRPFTGGSRMIQNRLLTPRAVLGLSASCFALGVLAGAWLFLLAGGPILWLGAAGLAGGFFYSAPPIKLGARGLGEPVVALLFGCLPAMGAYYIQAGRFSFDLFVLSLSLSVLILMVLFINEFQDSRADGAVGKRTWVVRLGTGRAARAYAAMMALWPLPILLATAAGRAPAGMYIALVPLLLAIPVLPRVLRCHDQPRLLAPANAATIILHLAVSLIMAAVLLVAR